ncbi:MAG: transposase [Candidatus Binataceae bacterium]|nr:transposase [Candidatus Binataceae bacterium]
MLDGSVITQCKPCHRHQEFLGFLNHLDRNVPSGLEIHLIADHYATHKHPAVKQWLAAHRRFHLHFTPTSASWLNLVERWFGRITSQAIRRGSFQSVAQLEHAIVRFLADWNDHAQPFVWTKSARHIQRSIHHAKLIYET